MNALPYGKTASVQHGADRKNGDNPLRQGSTDKAEYTREKHKHKGTGKIRNKLRNHHRTKQDKERKTTTTTHRNMST